MDLKTTLMERKSTRAFLDKEVPMDTINEIIEQSKTAPSGVNTQPWQVAVIQVRVKITSVISLRRLLEAE